MAKDNTNAVLAKESRTRIRLPRENFDFIPFSSSAGVKARITALTPLSVMLDVRGAMRKTFEEGTREG